MVLNCARLDNNNHRRASITEYAKAIKFLERGFRLLSVELRYQNSFFNMDLPNQKVILQFSLKTQLFNRWTNVVNMLSVER